LKSRAILTAAICFLAFMCVFFFSGQAHIYFNMTALLVVFTGTLGAALLGSGPGGLRQAWLAAKRAYAENGLSEGLLVKELLRTSHLYKRTGRIKLSENQMDYAPMRHGLEMLEEGYSEAEIREVFQAEAKAFTHHREQMERIFRNMATYAPSFGVAGSVIGLVGMLMGVGDTSMILKSIPVTLVSTLYGIVLANFLFLPLAEKLREDTHAELALRKLALCALVGMLRATDFLKLQTMLNALTTRHDAHVDGLQVIREIRESLPHLQAQPRSGMELAAMLKRS
jgi:chemotaxis protein MotA